VKGKVDDEGIEKGYPTKDKLNQKPPHWREVGRVRRENQKRQKKRHATHRRSRVPYVGGWRLEPVKDWFRVLPDDYATVPRVVLARKEHFINRGLLCRHSLGIPFSLSSSLRVKKRLGRGNAQAGGKTSRSPHMCWGYKKGMTAGCQGIGAGEIGSPLPPKLNASSFER